MLMIYSKGLAMIYYDAKAEKLIENNDPTLVALHACLQELQLWQGENPLDVGSGIDYFSVFNSSKYFELECQRVIEKHQGNFKSITLDKVERNTETLKAHLTFTTNDFKTIKAAFNVNTI